MTQYTQNYSLPYPEGNDAVAVHTDIEDLAKRIDVTVGSELEAGKFFRGNLEASDRLDDLASGTYWARSISIAEAVGLPSGYRGTLYLTRSGANGNAIFISNAGNHPIRVFYAERVNGWTWEPADDETDKFYRGRITAEDTLDNLLSGAYWVNTISIAEAVGLPSGYRGTLILFREGSAGNAIFMSQGGAHPTRVFYGERFNDEWIWQQNSDGISEIHAFLVAGQSNMSGHGTPYGDGMDPVDARILQFGARNRVVETATVPLNQHRDTVGLSIATVFAREYLKSQPTHVGVLLIAAARGASYLKPRPAGDYVWYPGGAAAPEYDLYSQAITQTQEALAADGRATLKGVLWHQGEGNNGDTEAEYIGYQDYMINQFREDLKIPDLPFLVGELVPEGIDNFPGRERVNVAISKTPARLERTAFSSAERGWAKYQDETHFSRSGVEELGKRYLHAYKVALSNTSAADPTPPLDVTSRRTANSVHLRWVPPLCRVTEYRVEYRDNGGTWRTVNRDNPMYPKEVVPGDATEARVSSVDENRVSTPVQLEV